MKLIDADTLDVIGAADVLELGGGWPIGGGWMDQTQACVDAVRYFLSEQKQSRIPSPDSGD